MNKYSTCPNIPIPPAPEWACVLVSRMEHFVRNRRDDIVNTGGAVIIPLTQWLKILICLIIAHLKFCFWCQELFLNFFVVAEDAHVPLSGISHWGIRGQHQSCLFPPLLHFCYFTGISLPSSGFLVISRFQGNEKVDSYHKKDRDSWAQNKESNCLTREWVEEMSGRGWSIFLLTLDGLGLGILV